MPDEATYDRILFHYAEIGTKGGNRPFFEKALRRNLAGALSGEGVETIRREAGRLAAGLRPDADVEEILARTCRIPGVAWAAPAICVPPTIEAITRAVVQLAVGHPESVFRVDTRRSDKTFPMDSLEVNRTVGAAVVQATGRSVSLGSPDYSYRVEIDPDHAYVYFDRRKGPGGLPVGTEGDLVALVSGGIDSPVAAYRMIVRGCRVHLVHFLNRSISTNLVKEKIEDLARRLSLFHGPIELSVVPFDDLQTEIVMAVPARYRMIVYRRAMFRIAEQIRDRIGAFGFVTGDSVGQVASQTLPNLRAIFDAADYPVYAPLAGMSKVEITDMAKRIGTYEISIRPHEDCCSFMVAKHPETRARLERIEEAERFDIEAGVAAAARAVETRRFDPRERAGR